MHNQPLIPVPLHLMHDSHNLRYYYTMHCSLLVDLILPCATLHGPCRQYNTSLLYRLFDTCKNLISPRKSTEGVGGDDLRALNRQGCRSAPSLPCYVPRSESRNLLCARPPEGETVRPVNDASTAEQKTRSSIRHALYKRD